VSKIIRISWCPRDCYRQKLVDKGKWEDQN